jgi:hypothetical protein
MRPGESESDCGPGPSRVLAAAAAVLTGRLAAEQPPARPSPSRWAVAAAALSLAVRVI